MEDKTQQAEHKLATALRYSVDAGDTAPQVVATGKGYVAEEILRIARENNIPLRQDPELAGALATLDVGASIPPELFRAVAEVIAFVFRLSGKMR
jgi:flagellar biosynthesis protein